MAAVSLAPLLPHINFSSATVTVVAVGAVFVIFFVMYAGVMFVLSMIKDAESGGMISAMSQAKKEDRLRTTKKRIRSGELVDRHLRRELAEYEGTGRKKRSYMNTRV